MRTPENVDTVNDLVLSQEDAPGTHRSVREITRETGIPTSSVVRIIHRDLKLNCVKKKRAQQLTAANQMNHDERSQLLRDKFSERDAGFSFSLARNCLPWLPR